MEEKKSKFGLGVIIGAIGGVLAGAFLAPKSGKQMRKAAVRRARQLYRLIEEGKVEDKVREIYGEITAELKDLYQKVRNEVLKNLEEIKDTVEDIDREKYVKIVEDAALKVGQEAKKDMKNVDKLKKHLISEWKKVN